jgi:hypothetical protein
MMFFREYAASAGTGAGSAPDGSSAVTPAQTCRGNKSRPEDSAANPDDQQSARNTSEKTVVDISDSTPQQSLLCRINNTIDGSLAAIFKRENLSSLARNDMSLGKRDIGRGSVNDRSHVLA